jgi:hypothetical protein
MKVVWGGQENQFWPQLSFHVNQLLENRLSVSFEQPYLEFSDLDARGWDAQPGSGLEKFLFQDITWKLRAGFPGRLFAIREGDIMDFRTLITETCDRSAATEFAIIGVWSKDQNPASFLNVHDAQERVSLSRPASLS